jgi:superfamily II DNA or RNA helicase
MTDLPAPGIYEELHHQRLAEVLRRHPELRSVFGKLDPEEAPARYTAFVARVLEQALREESKPETRLALANQVIALVSGLGSHQHLADLALVPAPRPLLVEITPPHALAARYLRPETPLTETSLFTGAPGDPPLARELAAEMASADQVDLLISFIKWSGLRLLMPAFEELRDRAVPVRVITTSYLGASDPPAVEWLARLANVRVRVSYDTQRTRLHAKAYHLRRDSGFSTAYIGSANMSGVAMTSGLEWNLKVTARDLPHILERFSAEFDTYWHSQEFQDLDPAAPQRFREAISRERSRPDAAAAPFFDLTPHPFQERILEALAAERSTHGRWRNLVIAATGTGKTVVAAFDFERFFTARGRQARLLYVAHRQEILTQALGTFRNVLRTPHFGELLVGAHQPARADHLFCSIGMLSTRRLWEQVGSDFYDYIVVDEAHHGTAPSYRPLFDHFTPRILLGLTATPERMDGKPVAADFDHRFAAEIRLPEALEEQLLCPFHYFGVADPVSLDADHFWASGKYVGAELEKVYTGAHALALKRLDAIQAALARYEPDLARVKGIGFCVNVGHAGYMARMFTDKGIPSAVLTGETSDVDRGRLIEDLRAGRLTFLFTVDVLNEGLDLPEINTVLFLRPTESLTIFLQQLGRGLRRAPGKDALTVLDLVGQAHRRYRIDRKLKALLPRHRYSIDKEVELGFPHLPAGCSIQLDPLARAHVLANIRANLQNLAVQIPERIQTFESEAQQALTFGNFVRHHDYEPELILEKKTWSEWKALSGLRATPSEPDHQDLRRALVRLSAVDGPQELARLRGVTYQLRAGNVDGALAAAESHADATHYRFWGKDQVPRRFSSVRDSLSRIAQNPDVLADAAEVLDWAAEETRVPSTSVTLPFPCPLELHARYGSLDISAALGLTTLDRAGQTGVGVLHAPALRAYAMLITFQKTEQEFSPSTMYADYPISRDLLHWESQSSTSQASATGQNLVRHRERGYTILLFARDVKKRNGVTAPFTYLGPGDVERFEGERPITVVYRLVRPMPAAMFEGNRRGG